MQSPCSQKNYFLRYPARKVEVFQPTTLRYLLRRHQPFCLVLKSTQSLLARGGSVYRVVLGLNQNLSLCPRLSCIVFLQAIWTLSLVPFDLIFKFWFKPRTTPRTLPPLAITFLANTIIAFVMAWVYQYTFLFTKSIYYIV